MSREGGGREEGGRKEDSPILDSQYRRHDIIHLLAYSSSLWPADVSITLKFPALMFPNERARNNPTDIPARF